MRAGLLAAAGYLGSALLLLRHVVGEHAVAGERHGEIWGALAMTAQVGRWIRGEDALAVGGLFGWPEVVPLWPVDPLLRLVELGLGVALGPVPASLALTTLLLALAGFGPWLLARTVGAAPLPAGVAGVIVQLAPIVLNNAKGTVTEIVAVGLLSVGAAAVVSAVRSRRWWVAALGIGVVAASSPYLTVFLALGSALAVPFTARQWRGWLAVGAGGLLAGCLLVAPLALSESGEGGRMSAARAGEGYRLVREEVVDAQGRPPGREVVLAGEIPLPPPSPPLVSDRRLRMFPGGFVAGVALLLGLADRRARAWSALGLVVWLLGPGLPQLQGLLGGRPGGAGGLLLPWLRSLPLLEHLGNPERFFLYTASAAGVAGALLADRWRVFLILVPLAAWEGSWHLPGLALPGVRVGVEPVLEALEGPTIVFPSGDPPLGHRHVGPKEALAYTALAGVPSPYDYGRGRAPVDIGLHVALARAGGVALGASAWRTPPAEDFGGMSSLLLLEDRLTEDQRARVVAWLEPRARRVASTPGASAWRSNDPAPAAAAAPPGPPGPR